MILSDVGIRKSIKTGKIKILPSFDLDDIRPTGIRLHLSNEILVPVRGQSVDLKKTRNLKFKRIRIPKMGYALNPGDFVLSSTIERIQTSADLVCLIDGRSTFARLGLGVHCTATVFDGTVEEDRAPVLELFNIGPFKLVLHSLIPIATLVIEKLTNPIEQESQHQYKNQKKVTPPNLRFKPNKNA